MKKRILMIAAAVAAMSMVSCEKESLTETTSSSGTGTILTATIAESEETSKVNYEEGATGLQPKWEVNDKIISFDDAGTTYTFNVESVAADGKATLKCNTTIPAETKLHLIYKKGASAGDIKSKKLSVSYAGQSGTTANLPAVMLSDGTVGGADFTFKNAGAIVAVSAVKGVPAGSTISAVTVSGASLSAATVALSGSTLVLTASITSGGSISAAVSGVTVTDGNGSLSSPVYVAVPAGASISGVSATVGGEVYRYSLSSAKSVAAGKSLRIRGTQTFVKLEGALSGEFSVSARKKVHFSKGNLQAKFQGGDATNYSWGFAENQYDVIGNAAGNTTIDSQTAGAVVDLFGWSTSSTYYGINTSTSSSTYSGDFVDWGGLIGDGSTWRTLASGEWAYLINTRASSTVSGTTNARYAKGTVDGVAGLIVLPDVYTHPEGVTALTSINTGNATFTENNYDSTSWTKMESAGCVFLPCAGLRSSSSVGSFGIYGGYWSSTLWGSTLAYCSTIEASRVSTNGGNSRSAGLAIRLITESL